jgi:hypothetical protein
MAVVALAFRSRFGNIDPGDVPGGFVLRGEVEWLVEGGENEIAALLSVVAELGGEGVCASGDPQVR